MTAEQVAALNAALDEAESAASAAWEKVSEVNAAYQKALDAGTPHRRMRCSRSPAS